MKANNYTNDSDSDAIYHPVSLLNIITTSLSTIFVACTTIIIISGILTNKLFAYTEPLFLGLISFILCFLYRRINHSDSTKQRPINNYTWWATLVSLLGYITYLVAIDFTIRREALSEAKLWIENATRGELNKINVAFIQTLSPGRRQNIPYSSDQLLAEFGDEYYSFTQSDLVSLGYRNPGLCRLTSSGLKSWSQRASNIECVVSLDVECPEGVFPVELQLKSESVVGIGNTSSDIISNRQWTILANPYGYVMREKVRLTTYGRMLSDVESSGAVIGKSIIDITNLTPTVLPNIYHKYIATPSKLNNTTDNTIDFIYSIHLLSGNCITLHDYNNSYWSYLRNEGFRLDSNKTPSVSQLEQFIYTIHNSYLSFPGTRIPKNDKIDGRLLTIVTDNSIRLYVPFEMQITNNSNFSEGVTRGKLFLICQDPDLLAELKSLRESNSTVNQSSRYTQLVRSSSWQLVRFESDLRPVKIQSQNDLLPLSIR